MAEDKNKTIQGWLGENNKLGIDIWEKKYRYNNETFDEWLDRISNKNEMLKQVIYDKKFIFGGRILANRGLDKLGKKITYSNCYVIDIQRDSIEGIYETCAKLARTYSYGGGCGIDISILRPAGAKVNNAAKTTSGAVSFMSAFDNVTSTIGQNGRRGALMISIDVRHPDVLEFIDIKTDVNKVNSANISIRVNDEFMKAVENNEDYYLRWPCKAEDFNKDICKEYNTLYEDNGVYFKKVKAKALFDKLCLNNWNYAEPGILYWDNIENYNLLSEDKEFHYAGVNPCLAPDQLILTDEGYKPIIDLCDKETNVWNGYEWSKAVPHVTGHNQPMKKIEFSDGTEVNCTAYHKFVLKDRERVEAKDLKVGDKLVKCDFPVIEGKETIDPKTAYTMGFFMGDGGVESERDRISIKLYKDKRNLLEHINHTNVNYCPSFDGDFVTLPFEPEKYNKTFVPDAKYTVETRLNWLAGYIDSDGTIQNKDNNVSISSVNKDVLLKVKRMLNTLGCNPKVTIMRKEGERMMPKNDGTGEYAYYHCQQSYRLLISSYYMGQLVGMGLNTYRVKGERYTTKHQSRFVKVRKIEDNGICETVYCMNEPKNHTIIVNGCITAQCAEEPLPAGGSCLLGSLNLSAFVEEGKYNFEELKRVSKIAYEALNEVLIEGLPLHPLKEQQECVGKYKQVGLGIMGLADTFIKLGIRYGSKESLELSNKIGSVIANAAMQGTIEMGKKKGEVSLSKEKAKNSTFFKNVADTETIEVLETSEGLFNTQLLTIAPTGTISTMWNISGGIEPIFALFYERLTKSLNGTDTSYKVYPEIVKNYFGDREINLNELPEYFVSSADLTTEERINMQSTWQKYIDASISSTVNLPEVTSVDDVKNIYLSAWKNNLKGITIFRSGCKRAAILIAGTKKECSCKDFLENSAPKRPKSLPAKILRFRNNGENWVSVVGLYEGRPYEIFTGLSERLNIPSNVGDGCIIRNKIEIEEYDEELGKNVKKSVSRYDFQYKDENGEKVSEGLSTCFNEEFWNYGKLVSGLLRHGMPIQYIVKVISSLKFKHEGINTWKNGVIRSLKKFMKDGETDEICPECGNKLVRENGCIHCPNCGWSKCN